MGAASMAKVRVQSWRRKEANRHSTQCLFHVASAFTYRSLCSAKRLARAWQVDHTTALRYQSGAMIGALTRLAWELVLLLRAGIDPLPILEFLQRVVEVEKRRIERGKRRTLAGAR